MRSNNPVLRNLPASVNQQGYGYQQQAGYQGYQQYQQPGYEAQGYQQPVQTERPMTVDDVVTKTGITLAVIIGFAVLNFGLFAFGGQSGMALSMILTLVGAIGGFITVLVHSFGKKFGSKIVTLIYAAFEGLFVGGISLILSGFVVGDQNAGMLIGQAVLGTVGVFIGMLFVYKTGAIRVTPRFNRMLMGALIGVAVLALGNFIGAMFFDFNVLRDGGPIAIIFSLVCIVLAAVSFLSDFDVADQLIRTGAPARMAWGVALGLAVTLVWLYTEILRLLSYFQRD
ncbi:Bax inhibitor-1/YccA family protein [Corynebacterium breve]|uniref:Bax inhibitor-1/YccA family protein n=1 Tax=Corynebacterium breve TaxID=3049799 RepID=A0ABY8VJT7_9CORY|nr:Bax inhibitor-1/YccA family protein [Corynebacterium breve]WIM68493.1 Bax inhibitor-1/YccA family protein [Corynebacterium breve]